MAVTTRNFLRKKFESLTALVNVFLFLFQIKSIFSGDQYSCYKVYTMSNNDCFNDKIELKNKFRAGHFVITKEGTLVIEYSNDGTNYMRLFYGLKKNGRYYFENETAFRHFNASNPNNNGNDGRYESKNIILHMKGDTSKQKEYIFSTSIWTTVTELHDLETGTSIYYDTVDFWEIVEIFSYEINLFELREGNDMNYVSAFTQHETDKIYLNGKYDDYSKTFSLRKFSFTDPNTFNIISKVDYVGNYNSRMISCFLVPEWQDIVVFFLKAADNEYKNAEYFIAFYYYNFNFRNEISKGWVEEPNSGVGIFFRGFYLRDRFCAFIYFKDKYGKYLRFEIGQLTDGEHGARKFDYRAGKNFDEHYYAPHVNYNDFFKVDDNRIVFVTTKYPYDKLYFFIFDLYNDYWNFRARKYSYNIPYNLTKEIQGYTYNGYIIFTYCSNEKDIYSTLLFFGYANGTDFTMDISPYLMDTGSYDPSNNLYNRLYETFSIDNNIFGYEKIPKINLVEIPNELLFYNGSGTTKETNKLPNNTFFDANHTLYQNLALNKTHKLYHIDFQFMVKEPDYDKFYHKTDNNGFAHDIYMMILHIIFGTIIGRRHFMGEQIESFLNYVTIIAVLVLNLEEQYMIKNV